MELLGDSYPYLPALPHGIRKRRFKGLAPHPVSNNGLVLPASGSRTRRVVAFRGSGFGRGSRAYHPARMRAIADLWNRVDSDKTHRAENRHEQT